MRATSAPKAVYVDALALVPERKSGIGFSLEQTIKSLSKLLGEEYAIYLVVPLGKAKHLNKYLAHNVKTKTIPLPARVMEVLLRTRLFPPVDWVVGRGIYLFPNYRNWSLWGSRSITYVYDVVFKRFPEMVQPKNQKYLSKYIDRWLARADKVVAISNYGKDEIEKYLHVPYSNIEVVYCGVDTAVFSKLPKSEVKKVKHKYGVNAEKYMLYVGNIEPRKNLVALLEAYERLPEKIHDEYALIIIGGGGWLNEPFFEKLSLLQAKHQNVLIVDRYVTSEDLPAFYSGASLLVHPAVYEGFGITPLEAMACGTAVAVSDIPVIREVVGDAGWYFDPFNVDNMSEVIAKAIQRGSDQQIENGKLRARDFGWSRAASDLQRIIEEEYVRLSETRHLARHLRNGYTKTDELVRKLLGERSLNAYQPPATPDKKLLKKYLYEDFLKEQPSLVQEFLLKLYLSTRHALAVVAKYAYRIARRRA